MRILFCGDIMPGGVLPYQDEYISKPVLDLLNTADYRVGTLECAIGDNIPFDKKKMAMAQGKNIVYAREKDFERIKYLGMNVVTLANNHIFDLGAEGLFNTIKLLDKNGIKHCGAGRNLQEASEPCYIIHDGLRIAFIGCCFEGLPPYTIERATETSPGIYQSTEKAICDLIQGSKSKADVVIVLPHWGVEYSYIPPQKCIYLAKRMIDAGADAVVGSHTHIMNPRMTYKGKPVYFSLGNFLFPDFCLQVPRPIYYPSTREEAYSLPTVTNYPKNTGNPVRVVWKKSSRIGVVAVLDFMNEDVKHTCTFAFLDAENVLQLCSGIAGRKESFKMYYFGSGLGRFMNRVIQKIRVYL